MTTPGGLTPPKRVCLIGGHPDHHGAAIGAARDALVARGREVRHVACDKRCELPSGFRIENFLDGTWVILLLPEIRGDSRDRVELAARQRLVPCISLGKGWDDASLTDSLARLDEPVPGPPRGVTIASKVIRKLKAQNKWGGSKSYLWLSDLPKGGFESEELPYVLAVADELVKHQILITKTSQGVLKVALNAPRRAELENVALGRVANPVLAKALERI